MRHDSLHLCRNLFFIENDFGMAAILFVTWSDVSQCGTSEQGHRHVAMMIRQTWENSAKGSKQINLAELMWLFPL